MLLEVLSFPKYVKSFYISSCFIPIPESSTIVIKSSLCIRTMMLMNPALVNFIAFPIRLNKTCLYLFWSVLTILGTSSSTIRDKAMPFCSHWNRIIEITDSKVSCSEKIEKLSSNLLFSSRLISRASSTMFCKWSALFLMTLAIFSPSSSWMNLSTLELSGMIEFRGVLSSWAIDEKNNDLAF